jgi:redox-sensitive bicupin YhaK (pirin superfamily)
MIQLRPSEERGHTRLDWLDSRHTFSFGDYRDARHMGYRTLRVINEDRVEPGKGFGTHGHRDMEIVTVVLSGELQHRDSLGNGTLIRPGEVQRMSAGSGVLHSEFNPSSRAPVHFLQIWILPEREGLAPGYEQRAFPEAEARDRLRVVASRDGREGSLTVHQDAAIWRARLGANARIVHAPGPGRHAWLQVARGAVRFGPHELRAGDGAAISNEAELALEGREDADLLLFDLA